MNASSPSLEKIPGQVGDDDSVTPDDASIDPEINSPVKVEDQKQKLPKTREPRSSKKPAKTNDVPRLLAST
jgi:hypothetical protein